MNKLILLMEKLITMWLYYVLGWPGLVIHSVPSSLTNCMHFAFMFYTSQEEELRF